VQYVLGLILLSFFSFSVAGVEADAKSIANALANASAVASAVANANTVAKGPNPKEIKELVKKELPFTIFSSKEPQFTRYLEVNGKLKRVYTQNICEGKGSWKVRRNGQLRLRERFRCLKNPEVNTKDYDKYTRLKTFYKTSIENGKLALDGVHKNEQGVYVFN
jgi:hypothetical protein